MRGCSDAVSSRLPGRTGHQDARRDPAARLRSRVHRREPAARPAAARRGVHGHRRRSPRDRHLPQGRSQPRHLRHHRRQRPTEPASGCSRRCATPAARSCTCSASAPATPPSAPRSSTPSFRTSRTSRCRSCFGGPLLTEFSRSLTRARVQQYQRYFSDADRVLILLHNDPDPDAMASGLALRNLLRRTKTTAIIGAMQGVTRPENLRMVNLLDIHVEPITADVARRTSTASPWSTCSRTTSAASSIAWTWSSTITPSSRATPPCSRTSAPDYGSTSTILTEHLRAVDVNISERDGDGHAVRDQVRHAVLQPSDQSRRSRGVLVPLSAGRRRADSQDGRRGNHGRAPRLRHQGASAAARSPIRSSVRSSAPCRARISSPTSPISSCSSKT